MATYGIEIEAYTDRRALFDRLCRAMPDIFGIGLDGGGVVEDRSIGRVRRRCAEIRSPVLPDLQAARRYIARTVAVLRDVGARISPTCGLHIHVGAPPGVDVIDGLAAVWTMWLPVQDHMLEIAYGPAWWDSRAYLKRVRYCAPWSTRSIEQAARLLAINEPSRYYVFNPFALRKHQTVEYRLWPMTLDAEPCITRLERSALHAAWIDWEWVKRSPVRAALAATVEEYRAKIRQYREAFHADLMRAFRNGNRTK